MNVPKSRVCPRARRRTLRFREDGAGVGVRLAAPPPPPSSCRGVKVWPKRSDIGGENSTETRTELLTSSESLARRQQEVQQEVRTLKVLQMTPPAQPGPTEHGTGRLGSAPVRPAGREQRWAGSRQAGLKLKQIVNRSDTTRTRTHARTQTNPELSLFTWLHIALISQQHF